MLGALVAGGLLVDGYDNGFRAGGLAGFEVGLVGVEGLLRVELDPEWAVRGGGYFIEREV